MIILGKVRPLSGRLLGPHPQVLIIARGQQLDSAYRVRLHSSAIRAQISTSQYDTVLFLRS
ncbi:hypothetical protein D2E95_21990 [Mycobacteroides abscessus]|nr:hypothetical protein D2E95_21990 [Mycobacteroides abscessus]RIU51360.1 hypothetical protein D2F02_12050 [Mycobacteroides abscessus]